MARVKRGVTTHKRHKKILEHAKGYRGRSSTCFRVAIEKVHKAWQYAYRDRRNKKREFRKLWIMRLNAAARQFDITYAQLINYIHTAEIGLNRKMLSELAISNPEAFGVIMEGAKKMSAEKIQLNRENNARRLADSKLESNNANFVGLEFKPETTMNPALSTSSMNASTIKASPVLNGQTA